MKRVKIKSNEIGFIFVDEQFVDLALPGVHWVMPFSKKRIEVYSRQTPIFEHFELRQMVKSGALKGLADVIDLRDWQRALIWVDGRFHSILPAGLFVVWSDVFDVRIEIIDARIAPFEHSDNAVINKTSDSNLLNVISVERDHAGVLFVDGRYHSTLAPGRYAFWSKMAEIKIVSVDLREQAIDVNGQDLMTSDKVTLRLNAIVTYRITDAKTSVSASDNVHQALYRATQLALRLIVGQHELDQFLGNKQKLADEALAQLSSRADELGLSIVSMGVRDVILPGEMKDLMNKVIEAKKAAEANLISRREETAAIRSQANTAKLLEANPTLMRLRELEVLEKVSESSNMQVVIGDKGGLAERMVRLV